MNRNPNNGSSRRKEALINAVGEHAFYRVLLFGSFHRFPKAGSVAFHRRSFEHSGHGRRRNVVRNCKNRAPVCPFGQRKCIRPEVDGNINIPASVGAQRKNCIHPAHSELSVVDHPVKCFHCWVGFPTEGAEGFSRTSRTQHFFVLKQDVGTFSEKLSGGFIQFEPPGCWLVTDPLQKVRERVRSNMADRFLSRAVAIRRGVRWKLHHSLAQPFSPVGRFPLPKRTPHQHTNHPPNREEQQQAQINASHSHGPTMMPPIARQASPKAQQQGRKFSQKQTKITKRGKGIYETSSFPSFPSVQISPQIINHKS